MIALVCTMLAVVACPVLFGRRTRPVAVTAVIGMIVTLILAIRLAGDAIGGGVSGFSTAPLAGMLIVDNLSACFQIVLVIFLLAVTWLWRMGSAPTETNAPEFFILLIGSALGMALMVSTNNLLMIVMAIETASLPSYAFVGFDKSDRRGAEASLKYMIFGAVCAAIMLYGVSLLYGLVGSLNVFEVAKYAVNEFAIGGNTVILAAALLCFLAGIAFKVSAVPFHFWCPDAFEGAKIEVTTWLSVVSKAAGLILLVRVMMAFSASVTDPHAMSQLAPVAWTIAILATITCTVGNFSAYKQESVKRMLAYSSIAHAGYMLMAAAVLLHPDQPNHYAAVTALLVYIIVYLFMNLGAFGVTALVSWDTGSDRMDAFNGLIRRAPWLAIPMVICLVSLVGLPPFAGFIGKWWVLVALGSLNSNLGWFLAIVAVLNTLISLYYYMRVVVRMTLHDDGQRVVDCPVGGYALVNICGVALLVLFLWAAPLKRMTDRFSQDLYRTTVATASPGATLAADTGTFEE